MPGGGCPVFWCPARPPLLGRLTPLPPCPMQLQSAKTQEPLRKEPEQRLAGGAAAPPFHVTQLSGSPPLHSLADL